MGKKKLSKKEQGETVTRGYFHDTLEEVLESKSYVTKDYLYDAFESQRKLINQDMLHMRDELRDDSHRYMESLMEDNRHQIRILMEGNSMRFERLERHAGLGPWVA